MANTTVVPPVGPATGGVGAITQLTTSSGTAVTVLPTATGHIMVGPNLGHELTVVVSGPTTAAMTLGDIYNAAASGVEALSKLFKTGDNSQCAPITIEIKGDNNSVSVCQGCTK